MQIYFGMNSLMQTKEKKRSFYLFCLYYKWLKALLIFFLDQSKQVNKQKTTVIHGWINLK